MDNNYKYNYKNKNKSINISDYDDLSTKIQSLRK